jgi:Zn-dependent protease with chaperone function
MTNNKYLKIQVTLFLLLLAGVTILISKYFTFLVHETVVYCQKIISQPDLVIRSPHLLVVLLLGLVLFHFSAVFIFRLLREFYIVNEFAKDKVALTPSVLAVIKKYNISEESICLFANEGKYAFCFGVINPRIYISAAFVKSLDQDELEAVLLHEYFHLKQRHSAILTFSKFMTSLFPFFPILSDLHALIKDNQEIAADNFAVIKLQGSKPLVNVLKKLVLNKHENGWLFVSPFYEEITIENRVKNLKNIKTAYPTFSLPKVSISILSSILVTILLSLPVTATEIHSNGEDAVMVCLNKDCQRSCEAEIETAPQYKQTQSISYPYTPFLH